MARKYPRTNAPTVSPDPEEQSMKIQYQSVHIKAEIPRLAGGDKGLAVSSTKFFHIDHGVTVEFDTATQLVRISKGDLCQYVPRDGVERFGPTLEDLATQALNTKARADLAAKEAAIVAAANARKAEEKRRADADAAAIDAASAAQG